MLVVCGQFWKCDRLNKMSSYLLTKGPNPQNLLSYMTKEHCRYESIKNLEMGRLSYIIWVGLEYHHKITGLFMREARRSKEKEVSRCKDQGFQRDIRKGSRIQWVASRS